MTKIYGMAMRVTKKNRKVIIFLNNGAKIRKSCYKKPTYFVFPYNYNDVPQLLKAKIFHDNFRFNNKESTHFFVDVEEI